MMFNDVLTAYLIRAVSAPMQVFPGFLTPILTQLPFQADDYLSHMHKRNFSSTRYWTPNHQDKKFDVMRFHHL